MQIDSEFAGILVAVGLLLIGLVSMPIVTWFLLGALGSVAASPCYSASLGKNSELLVIANLVNQPRGVRWRYFTKV